LSVWISSVFTYHMSYADLVVVLNKIVQEGRILNSSERQCLNRSLQNPFLIEMIRQYPLTKSAANLLQTTIEYMAQHPDEHEGLDVNVHNIIFSEVRERTKRYLKKNFPAKKRPDLMEKLNTFVMQELQDSDSELHAPKGSMLPIKQHR